MVDAKRKILLPRGNLKVNLHLTQRCNFHCRYCFARFPSSLDLRLEKWKKIIDNLRESRLVGWINFAGGEPLLHPDFSDIVDYAYDSGFLLSLISNGYFLTNRFMFPRYLFKEFFMLGVSLDSLNPSTLEMLGCYNSYNNYHFFFDGNSLLEVIKLARKKNPEIKIEINTVVTQLNKNEKMDYVFSQLPIHRWKILKLNFFQDTVFSNRNLQVTDKEFSAFLQRNRRIKNIIPEASMVRSYIIIDNNGNLLDNQKDTRYTIVGNLLEEPFTKIFKRFSFNRVCYQERC